MRLFAALDIYRDIDSRSAAVNMAIDDALMDTVTVPTIRFYRWDHPALSFGYFGRFDDVAAKNGKRDLVRRWTGGGIVLHGDDLTYSIVIPPGDPAFSESSMSIYEKSHAAIHAALAETRKGDFQIAPPPAPLGPVESRRSMNSGIGEGECFSNPVRADVLLNGRKIAGAAQRRTRRGLLQQGSIQGVDLPVDFTHTFAGYLSGSCREKRLSERVLQRSQEIAAQKYATIAWLRRR